MGPEPVFSYRGRYSDFPPSAAIPVDEAREAMRLFFRSGRRPTNIAWQE